MKELFYKRIKANSNPIRIVKNSTPIICFGNIHSAQLATLGLNPSRKEFLDKNGIELIDNNRRFETLTSLGTESCSKLSDEQVEKIIDRCLYYFKGKNPYKGWFNQLQDNILNPLELSYYNDDVCHLDILQWATDPTWGKLTKNEVALFIEDDINFLKEQLINSKINTLLINGNGVFEIFKNYFNLEITSPIKIAHQLFVKNKKCNLWELKLHFSNKEIKVLAWSQNLQSSKGITRELKKEIGQWVKETLNEK